MVTGDRGAAAVWSLALTVLLVVVALVIAMVGSIGVARARAANVADLAALAGARTGSCASAGGVAARNGMRLSGCSLDDGDVAVRVATPMPALARRVIDALGGATGDITADARAGYGMDVDDASPG